MVGVQFFRMPAAGFASTRSHFTAQLVRLWLFVQSPFLSKVSRRCDGPTCFLWLRGAWLVLDSFDTAAGRQAGPSDERSV